MKSPPWYVIKRNSGHCEISQDNPEAEERAGTQPVVQYWGPFESQAEAIARRVGLIRAGKCQPVQPKN